MLGYAFQRGFIPLSSDALLRAIELNGAAAAENRRAFSWGRRAAHDPAGVEALTAAGEPAAAAHRLSVNPDETVERRQERELTAGYERTLAHVLEHLDRDNLGAAVALAGIPETVLGYGPVKERSILRAQARQKELMAAFDQAHAVMAQAA